MSDSSSSSSWTDPFPSSSRLTGNCASPPRHRLRPSPPNLLMSSSLTLPSTGSLSTARPNGTIPTQSLLANTNCEFGNFNSENSRLGANCVSANTSPLVVRRRLDSQAQREPRSHSTESNNRSTIEKKPAAASQNARALAGLPNRWSRLGDKLDQMSREELASNFKQLTGDHLKLEKFMSVVMKENDMTRARLEEDLLDSVMQIEKLRTTLERQRKETEKDEGHALMRQNRKLNRRLADLAQRADKAELRLREQRDQNDLLEFQLMEAQNHQQSMNSREDQFTQTLEPRETAVSSRLVSLNLELARLRRENTDLREQLNADGDENSMTESEMGRVMLAENTEEPFCKPVPNDENDSRINSDAIRSFEFYRHRCAELERRITDEQVKVNSVTHQDRACQADHRWLLERRGRIRRLRQFVAASNDSNIMKLDPALLNSENVEKEEDDGQFDPESTINQLIMKSLFSLTCMVPLEDRILSVRAQVPEIWRRPGDTSLLRETINTFHVLIAEKEEEIGSLKDKLKAVGAYSTAMNSNIKFTDVCCQSEVDMITCGIIDKRLAEVDGQPNLDEYLTIFEKYFQELGFVSAVSQTRSTSELRLANLATTFIEMRDELVSNRHEKMRFSESECEKKHLIATLEKKLSILEKNVSEIKTTEQSTNGDLGIQLYDRKKYILNPDEMRKKIKQLEHDNRRWKSYVEHMGKADNELVKTLATLEERVREMLLKEKLMRKEMDTNASQLKDVVIEDPRYDSRRTKTVRYYSVQLQEIRHQNVVDQLNGRLDQERRRRKESDQKVVSLNDALKREREERGKLQNRVESTRHMENALRKRIETLEMSQNDQYGEDCTMSSLRARVAILDAEKTSLSATMLSNSQRDKQMIHEQSVKIKELDALRQTMADNVSHMRITEQALTRKLIKMEATYEEMIEDMDDMKRKDLGVDEKKEDVVEEQVEDFFKQKIDFMEKTMNQLEQEKIRLLRDVKSVSLEREKLNNTKSALEDKLRRFEIDQSWRLQSSERGTQDTLLRISALNARKELVEQRNHELEFRNAQYLEHIRDLEEEKEALRIEIGRMHMHKETEGARNVLNETEGARSMHAKKTTVNATAHKLVVKEDADSSDADRRLLRHQLAEAERQEELLRAKIKVMENREEVMKEKMAQYENSFSSKTNTTSTSHLLRDLIVQRGDENKVLQERLRQAQQTVSMQERLDKEKRAEITELRQEIERLRSA